MSTFIKALKFSLFSITSLIIILACNFVVKVSLKLFEISLNKYLRTILSLKVGIDISLVLFIDFTRSFCL